MQTISELLAGGKPKTLGNANEVAGIIGSDEAALKEVFREMLQNTNPLIQLRAGNALAKAAKIQPEILLPLKAQLLLKLPEMQQAEIIWHVAPLLPVLNLNEDELALAVNTLFSWFASMQHKFVKVNCLQALADLAQKHSWLKPEVKILLETALQHESAALKARARKLLKHCK